MQHAATTRQTVSYLAIIITGGPLPNLANTHAQDREVEVFCEVSCFLTDPKKEGEWIIMQRGKDRRELFRAIRVMRLPHEQEGLTGSSPGKHPIQTIISEVLVVPNNLGGLGRVKGLLKFAFRRDRGWSVNENHQGETLLTQGKQGRGELQRFWNWY